MTNEKCPICGYNKWTNWKLCRRCNKEAYKRMKNSLKYIEKKMKLMKEIRENYL